MTDKDYVIQKKRVLKYINKWHKPLGLGWYTVDFVWDRTEDKEVSDTAAKTTWRWQYRTACVTFHLPVITDLSDDKVESVVVHEFAHILTGSMVQNAPDDNSQLMEYGTETVAKALIWAREAGRKDK